MLTAIQSHFLCFRTKRPRVQISDNYTLNLSNGGKYDFLTDAMKPLSITRGRFYAVKVPKGKRLRDMFQHKVFQCPIKCGTCTRIGHACGSKNVFKGKDIVIAMH